MHLSERPARRARRPGSQARCIVTMPSWRFYRFFASTGPFRSDLSGLLAVLPSPSTASPSRLPPSCPLLFHIDLCLVICTMPCCLPPVINRLSPPLTMTLVTSSHANSCLHCGPRRALAAAAHVTSAAMTGRPARHTADLSDCDTTRTRAVHLTALPYKELASSTSSQRCCGHPCG